MTIKTVARSTPRSTVAGDAKVTVPGEYTDHYVKEEQNELFPKCVKSSMDLKVISLEAATRKQELMADMSEGMASVR